jgi:DNA-binding NarL/FixJ family response regulator
MTKQYERKACRSDQYQALFNEVMFSNEMMTIFSNDDSLSKRLDPFSYDERILELEDELKKEFWRIVETLTTRQKEVLKLCAAGYTQMEIAKKLKVNQSSIVKSG